MCGIAGYFGRNLVDAENIHSALELLKNRGPEIQQFNYVLGGENTDPQHLVLLHSRLSIIDLDKRANQPFSIGPCVIVFNGEIYNYIELRTEMEVLGVTFNTSSDTEVLLQAYLQYGMECTKKFEGMWSFAIWDGRCQQLFLSRDRFAEKPLYYYKSDGGIYFASEIKSLKALSCQKFEINQDQVLRYLMLGYKSLYKRDQTYFEKVFEVPSASTMRINVNFETDIEKYWQPQVQQKSMSLDDAIEGSRHLLFESMRIRLRSDVPLAFCLSGGIDSSALASISVKKFGIDVATFSIIESDERYNEYENIMATIKDLGCKHTLLSIPQDGGIERLKALVAYHDAPVATTTYYVHSLLSEQISADGYRVAFSGTAADELYTGYFDHYLLHLNELRDKPDYETYLLDWQKYIAKFIRNPIFLDADLYLKKPDFREHVFDNSIEFLSWLTPEMALKFDYKFSEKKICPSLLRNRMLNELFEEIIPVILHEDDLNSMFYSVENRSPYLDSRLCEFMYSVPPEYLIKNGYGKYILRESLKGVLNDQVRLDRKKKGFNASVNSLFDLKSEQLMNEFLNPNNEVFNYVQYDKVAYLFDIDALPNHYSKFVFNLINTQIFLEQN